MTDNLNCVINGNKNRVRCELVGPVLERGDQSLLGIEAEQNSAYQSHDLVVQSNIRQTFLHQNHRLLAIV